MYGDSTINTNQSDPLNTWESNFKGVYHLGDGSTVVGTDSTGQAAGTKQGILTAGAGEINGDITGMSGDSANYISLANPSLIPNHYVLDHIGVAETSSRESRCCVLGRKLQQRAAYRDELSDLQFLAGSVLGRSKLRRGSLDTSNLQYVVGTFDGSNLRLYKNGSLVGGPTAASPATSITSEALIGRGALGNSPWSGDIDEVRIAATARSAGWITTEYNNQNSPGTFITMGSESCTTSTPTPTPTGTPIATPTPTPPPPTPTSTPPPPTPTPTATPTSTPTPTATPTATPTPGPTTACQRSLTIDHTKVPSTQSNFTALVSLTDPALKTVANGGHVANANGYDIGFYADSGGTTKLKWEVEQYNGTTGNLIAWVKIPSVSSSTDTVFYLMYGDSTINTNQSDPLNTWESNFKGVYHLGDGSTVVGTDSTGQAAGTKQGILTAGAGEINGDITGMSGDSANYISLANPSSFPITTSWTISAWLKPVAGNHVAVFWGGSSNNGPHIGMNYPIFNSWRVAFWGGVSCDGLSRYQQSPVRRWNVRRKQPALIQERLACRRAYCSQSGNFNYIRGSNRQRRSWQ